LHGLKRVRLIGEKEGIDMLNKAIAIAAKAHDGQVDKGDKPYILHPLRVMMKCECEAAKICAAQWYRRPAPDCWNPPRRPTVSLSASTRRYWTSSSELLSGKLL